MYIKNQLFTNADTLEEYLFDFELGTPSDIIKNLNATIAAELKADAAFQKEYAAQTNDEDRLALYTDECLIRLKDKLLSQFDAFEVMKSQLSGIKNGTKSLLYDMSDLY